MKNRSVTMASPIEPYLPTSRAKSDRPFPTPDLDKQHAVENNDVVSLSGSGGSIDPLMFLAHGTESAGKIIARNHGDLPGIEDCEKKGADTLPYLSLAFSYLPMAAPVPKTAVHLVMQGIASLQDGSLENGTAIKENTSVQREISAEKAVPPGTTPDILSRAEAGDLSSLRRLAAMIGEEKDASSADNDPKTCLPRLEKLVSNAAGRGFLQKSRKHFEAYQSICRGVMKQFPERVTARFLENEVIPLCNCPRFRNEDDIMMLWAAWSANPKIVEKGVKYLCSRESAATPNWHELHTIEVAMEYHGYIPDALSTKWLFKGIDGISIDASGSKRFELEQALDILVKAKDQDPGLITSISLPSGDKESVPATRALFHRLKEAPDFKPDRHWQASWTTSLLKLAFPDRVLQEELISSLGNALALHGTVNSLDNKESKDLETLAVLPLEGQEKERFLNLLGGDLLNEQSGNDHAWIVDRARGHELRRGLDHIKEVPASVRLDEVLRLLEISQIDRSMMNREYWSERLIPAAFPSQDSAARRKAADSLWDGFKESYGKAGTLKRLSRQETAMLQVLESLSQEGDDALSRRLTELLLAELRTGETPRDGAPYYICQRLRKKKVTENIGILAAPSTKGAERRAIIDETRDLLGQITWDKGDLTHLLEETLNAYSYVQEMSGALEKNGGVSPVELVREEDDAWLVLDGIRLHVNESNS
jgi:hypothetical protein